MQIHPSDRLQSAAQWKAIIADTIKMPTLRVSSQDMSLELERSLTRLVEETNEVVKKSRMIPVEPERKAVPQPTPSKPDWIDEFNRESLAPRPEARSREPAVEDPSDSRAAEVVEIGAGAVPDPRPRAVISETDWIDRAFKKQERIRSERERALGLFDDEGVRDIATSGGDEMPIPAEDIPEMMPPPRPGVLTRLRPIGLVIGLISCFYVGVKLEGGEIAWDLDLERPGLSNCAPGCDLAGMLDGLRATITGGFRAIDGSRGAPVE